ncbi:MAG TPA: hypothetical protein VGG02_05050 [Chthoniobacterales bacterium]|jgi:hypothetical protein
MDEKEREASKDLLKHAGVVSPNLSKIPVTLVIDYPAVERSYAIRRPDWRRLERDIANLPTVSDSLAVWWSSCFGAGVALLAAVLPAIGVPEVKPIIIEIEGCACAVMFALALAFKLIETIFLKKAKDAREEILADMRELVITLQSAEKDAV